MHHMDALEKKLGRCMLHDDDYEDVRHVSSLVWKVLTARVSTSRNVLLCMISTTSVNNQQSTTVREVVLDINRDDDHDVHNRLDKFIRDNDDMFSTNSSSPFFVVYEAHDPCSFGHSMTLLHAYSYTFSQDKTALCLLDAKNPLHEAIVCASQPPSTIVCMS